MPFIIFTVPANAAPHFIPKIDETSANSNTVGTILKTIAESTKLIPLEPLSIVLESAPGLENTKKFKYNFKFDFIAYLFAYLSETTDLDYVNVKIHSSLFF